MNPYLVDKVIESIILSAVVYVMLRYNTLNYFVLFVLILMTLVIIDVLLGIITKPNDILLLVPRTGTGTGTGTSTSTNKRGGSPPFHHSPLPDASHLLVQSINVFDRPAKMLGHQTKSDQTKSDQTKSDRTRSDPTQKGGMDDPVAKLYYSQNRIPPSPIDAEALYKQQYELHSKDCRGKPPGTGPEPKSDTCLYLPGVGQTTMFGQDDYGQKGGHKDNCKNNNKNNNVNYNEESGTDHAGISFEDRYRRGTLDQMGISDQADQGCKCGPTCQSHLDDLPGLARRQTPNRPQATINIGSTDNNPAWLFGTYSSHADKGNLRAAPYCQDVPQIDCDVKLDPILADALEPTCAVGLKSCLPCDLSEIPHDFAHPLNDRILTLNPYRECRRDEKKVVEQKYIKRGPDSLVQPHYVKSYPEYVITRKNLAIE